MLNGSKFPIGCTQKNTNDHCQVMVTWSYIREMSVALSFIRYEIQAQGIKVVGEITMTKLSILRETPLTVVLN